VPDPPPPREVNREEKEGTEEIKRSPFKYGERESNRKQPVNFVREYQSHAQPKGKGNRPSEGERPLTAFDCPLAGCVRGLEVSLTGRLIDDSS
jgi:hypothetical protein